MESEHMKNDLYTILSRAKDSSEHLKPNMHRTNRLEHSEFTPSTGVPDTNGLTYYETKSYIETNKNLHSKLVNNGQEVPKETFVTDEARKGDSKRLNMTQDEINAEIDRFIKEDYPVIKQTVEKTDLDEDLMNTLKKGKEELKSLYNEKKFKLDKCYLTIISDTSIDDPNPCREEISILRQHIKLIDESITRLDEITVMSKKLETDTKNPSNVMKKRCADILRQTKRHSAQKSSN